MFSNILQYKREPHANTGLAHPLHDNIFSDFLPITIHIWLGGRKYAFLFLFMHQQILYCHDYIILFE